MPVHFAAAGPAAGAFGGACRGGGAGAVTALELAVGLACRRVLHVAVWDYSDRWGNLAGLICPAYSALWFLLCAWVLTVMRLLARATVGAWG